MLKKEINTAHVMITLPERIYKTDCVVVEYQPEQYVKLSCKRCGAEKSAPFFYNIFSPHSSICDCNSCLAVLKWRKADFQYTQVVYLKGMSPFHTHFNDCNSVCNHNSENSCFIPINYKSRNFLKGSCRIGGTMKKDGSWKGYFEDPARFADAINGFGCNGEQVVKEEDIQEADTQIQGWKIPRFVNSFVDGRRVKFTKSRDMLRKVALGVHYLIIAHIGVAPTPGSSVRGQINLDLQLHLGMP